jgi:hypothetical protein
MAFPDQKPKRVEAWAGKAGRRVHQLTDGDRQSHLFVGRADSLSDDDTEFVVARDF